MKFNTIEGYYSITVTKRLQLCKAKQFFKNIKTLKQGVRYVQS